MVNFVACLDFKSIGSTIIHYYLSHTVPIKVAFTATEYRVSEDVGVLEVDLGLPVPLQLYRSTRIKQTNKTVLWVS